MVSLFAVPKVNSIRSAVLTPLASMTELRTCSVMPDLQLGTLFLTLKNNTLSLLLIDASLNIFTSHITSTPSAFEVFTVNTLYKLLPYLLTYCIWCVESKNDRRNYAGGGSQFLLVPAHIHRLLIRLLLALLSYVYTLVNYLPLPSCQTGCCQLFRICLVLQTSELASANKTRTLVWFYDDTFRYNTTHCSR